MTEEQLKKAVELQNRILRLNDGKICGAENAGTTFAPEPIYYSHIISEFFDVELYNQRVQAAIDAAQKQFDLL